jgi:hypothetical protein
MSMRGGMMRFISLFLALIAPISSFAQTVDRQSPSMRSGPYFGLTPGYDGSNLVGHGGAETGSQDGRETSIYTSFSWLRGQAFYGIEYDLTLQPWPLYRL